MASGAVVEAAGRERRAVQLSMVNAFAIIMSNKLLAQLRMQPKRVLASRRSDRFQWDHRASMVRKHRKLTAQFASSPVSNAQRLHA